MKLLHSRRPAPARRGAALLLAILVLFVLIAIVAQISITTMTDARVGRNDVGQTLINQSIRSAQHDIFELLVSDAEAGEEGGSGGDPMADATSAMSGAGSEESAPCDSRKDEWAVRQRTEINGIQILIQVEAENSKYNVLNMLNADEDEAEEAFQRVVRIIDLYREGTDVDVTRRDAEQMATAMRTYMQDRHGSGLPEPTLLTFDEERDSVFLPQSLRDFLAVEPFQEHHFRSFRDQNDRRVNSLDQFLTVWSSPATFEDLQGGGSTGTGSTASGGGAGGTGADPTAGGDTGTGTPVSTLDAEGNVTTTTTGYDESGEVSGADGSSGASGTGTSGSGSAGGGSGASAGGTSGPNGYGVNLNLAPAAVLKGLFDDRDVRGRFWDDVIEYRNLEEETEPGAEEPEPLYDEFGDEVVERRAFESVTELSEVRSWEDLQPDVQAKVTQLLETESNVFTIYITGRRNTSVDDEYGSALTAEERARAEEEPSGALVRTVRVVVWRRTTDDGVEIVPLVPWEELDYTPFEIEDYPED
ncbi:MAG: hypothetical protein H6828_11835 [Planctomycetes bacterium]|nr:hypothetical protein [Planctomycetota bacterium]